MVELPLKTNGNRALMGFEQSFDGGRTWWAHFEFTRMNIEPIILCKEIEDLREAGALMWIAS